MTKLIYQQLLNNFELLDKSEKEAIILYQSKLFYFINEISRIDNYQSLTAEEIFKNLSDPETFFKSFKEYKNIIDDIKNLFFKISIFKNVSFENIYLFINSILDLIEKLKSIQNKIILENDITVYRGINTNNYNNLIKGEFLSTSLDLDTALQFIEGDKKSILFKLNLKAPLSILTSPYRIGLFYEKDISPLEATLKNISPTVMKIINCGINSQQEIILFQEEIAYEVVSKKEIDNIIIIEANIYNKIKEHKKYA